MLYDPGWRRSVYDSSPHWAKNFFATAYGLAQRRRRYGRHFYEVERELRRLEYASRDIVHDYQLEQVRGFLRSAQSEVPYYRALFAECGFDPARLKDLDGIRCLPILSKAQVRERTHDLISLSLGQYHPDWEHTSGTTGGALHFPIARCCFQREYAFRSSHYSWVGVDLADRQTKAFAAGHPVAKSDRDTPPFWVYDHTNHWLLLSSYHLSPSTMPAYSAALEEFQPVTFQAIHHRSIDWHRPTLHTAAAA